MINGQWQTNERVDPVLAGMLLIYQLMLDAKREPGVPMLTHVKAEAAKDAEQAARKHGFEVLVTPHGTDSTRRAISVIWRQCRAGGRSRDSR